jgi:hypothetical protein
MEGGTTHSISRVTDMKNEIFTANLVDSLPDSFFQVGIRSIDALADALHDAFLDILQADGDFNFNGMSQKLAHSLHNDMDYVAMATELMSI